MVGGNTVSLATGFSERRRRGRLYGLDRSSIYPGF